MPWQVLTRRMQQPKLGFILELCRLAGLSVRRQPMDCGPLPNEVVMVHRGDQESAMEFVRLLDELPDNDMVFSVKTDRDTLKLFRAAYGMGADKPGPIRDAFVDELTREQVSRHSGVPEGY
jgi:hypothetical protein